MSEQSPAQMPTAPQPCLKDTPIASNRDSDSKTTTDTPFGVILSNDGVCAKESGAAIEEISTAVKRKVEQLQATDAKKPAKKPRVSSEKSVISEDVISNTNPLHEGIVIPTDGPSQESKLNVTILATYESETITRMEDGWKNRRVSVISWGSIENVNALVGDGLLSTATNWALIPEQFKDALVTTAIEKNRWVLEFFSEQRKNELDHSVLVSAIEWDSLHYTNLSEQQKQRKDLVILCIDVGTDEPTEQSEIVENIPITFNDDIDVVLRLIRNYGQARCEWFHSDRTRFNGFRNPYEWCAPGLFSDPVFVMQAVKHDFGIMLHVMNHHTEIYKRLKDNKTFAMLFIDIYTRQCHSTYDFNPLEYVSGRLRDDPAVLKKVFENWAEDNYWGHTLDYASKRLCESPDFVIDILEYLPIDDVDPDEVREMLATNCPFLACDIDFIKRVIRDKGAEAICWFDEWFRNDDSTVKSLL